MNEPKTGGASVPLDCAVGAPNRIWLQWHGDEDPADWPNHPDPIGSDVTWCAEQIYEHDVQYVRYEHLAHANVLSLKKALQKMVDMMDFHYKDGGIPENETTVPLKYAREALRPNTNSSAKTAE